MREALTRSQLNAARRLLDRGLRLREIAGRIDASFEAVCLGLFGGNPPTDGDDDGTHDAQPVDGGDGIEPFDDDVHAPDDDVVDSPAVEASAQAPLSFGLRKEGGAAAAPEPAGTPEPPGEPAEPVLEPPPGQRFRLVSEHGESLHENERVLTRMPKFFWRGDAGDVAMLKARRPQWARLKPVGVLS